MAAESNATSSVTPYSIVFTLYFIRETCGPHTRPASSLLRKLPGPDTDHSPALYCQAEGLSECPGGKRGKLLRSLLWQMLLAASFTVFYFP